MKALWGRPSPCNTHHTPVCVCVEGGGGCFRVVLDLDTRSVKGRGSFCILQCISPSKCQHLTTRKWGSWGASMVKPQCPRWTPAAPAPQLSLPTVLDGASSAFRSTGVFQPLPSLNGWGCDRQDSTGLGVGGGGRVQVPTEPAPMSSMSCVAKFSKTYANLHQHLALKRGRWGLIKVSKAKVWVGPLQGTPPLFHTATSQERPDGNRSKAHHFKEEREGGTKQIVKTAPRDAPSEQDRTAKRVT